MPTLHELKTQIADLEKQAAEMHARESDEAIATVRDLVARYGLTAEQIGLAPSALKPGVVRKQATRGAPAKTVRAGAGVAKYADPATGKTWTGFGKPPGWIASAKDREAFRLGAPSSAQPAVKSPAAAKRGAGRAKAG